MTTWTGALKWWFLGLQVAGIYLAATILLVLFVGAFFLFSFIATILGQPTPSAGAVVRVLLFGQPLLTVGMVGALMASIVITRGALRLEAWAHWGAMALIAASTVAVILMAVTFREPAFWIIGLVYCAAGVAFLVAMTYAFVKYGPWGMTTSIR